MSGPSGSTRNGPAPISCGYGASMRPNASSSPMTSAAAGWLEPLRFYGRERHWGPHDHLRLCPRSPPFDYALRTREDAVSPDGAQSGAEPCMRAAIALMTGEILALQVIEAHCHRNQFRHHLRL